MIVVYDYTLEKRKSGVYSVIPDNYGICPDCTKGNVIYRDYCSRICREIGGKRDIYIIQRAKCEYCGKLHRMLPDFMVKYKQYSAFAIRNVIERKVTIDDGMDHPSDMTIFRWLRSAEV